MTKPCFRGYANPPMKKTGAPILVRFFDLGEFQFDRRRPAEDRNSDFKARGFFINIFNNT